MQRALYVDRIRSQQRFLETMRQQNQDALMSAREESERAQQEVRVDR